MTNQAQNPHQNKLSREELRRYSRQIVLDGFGLNGQEHLRQKSALVVGLGGLGSPVAQHLVASGVGRVGLCEHDTLELHNLQRQTLYTTPNVGQAKLELARVHLHDLNPHVQLVTHAKLEAHNAAAAVADYDVVVDCSDNFATRYAISDACVQTQRTLVWGAAQQWEGMVSVFNASFSLRDAFPNPPQNAANCDTVGVFGPLLAVVGGWMAGEALKHLLGQETLFGTLLLVDAQNGTTRRIKLVKEPKKDERKL